MASLSLNTSIGSYVFTSMLPAEIQMSTDQETVDIEVYDSSNSKSIFSTDLDSYCGIVSLYDLRSIIEEYMREEGLSYIVVKIKGSYDADGAITELLTHSFSVIYCSLRYLYDVETYTQNNFLTTLNGKLTHKSVTERLSYFIKAGETQKEVFQIIVSVDGGTPYVVNHSLTIQSSVGSDKIVERSIGYDTLMTYTGLDSSKTVIRAFSYSVGKRTFCFYYSERKPSLVLKFRNSFNCFEVGVINGESTKNTKVDRSVATTNGINSFYDQTTERTHEVETAGVSKQIADWFEQLMMSQDVRKCIDGMEEANYPEILITDSTCEVSDKDDGLNVIKFKWQYADALPSIPSLPEGDKIFTDEFNDTYQ